MAETEADKRRSGPEPVTSVEGEQGSPSAPKPKSRGRPRKEKAAKEPKVKTPKVPKEKAPKVPKEKVPRGRGRPKGRAIGFSTFDTPPVHDMVVEALETLQDRKGVTLQAIKRFMEDNYKVDLQRKGVRIRKAILAGLESGDIIRTQGAGANGRFKLKPFKVAVANKREAPKDYVQLPYGKSSESKLNGKNGKIRKAISETKSLKEAASSPAKGKRGRPKKK